MSDGATDAQVEAAVGRAFRVESRTVGMDGREITDEPAPAAVVKAQKPQPAPDPGPEHPALVKGGTLTEELRRAVYACRLLELAVARAFHYGLGRDRNRPEVAVRTSGAGSPALWSDDPDTLGAAYAQAMQEVARAHRCFARAGAPNHWVTGIGFRAAVWEHLQEVDTAERGRERIKWLRRLLGWAQTTAPTEQDALREACNHIRAALKQMPSGLYVTDQPAPVTLCSNSVNGCPNEPRPNGTQCSTCANYRSRHGKDRVVGEDGKAA